MNRLQRAGVGSVYSGISSSENIIRRRNGIKSLVRNGFPYSRKLSAHGSCVNVLTFSRNGKWLASAGDDPYIILWDFHQDDILDSSYALRGPRANVFCLAFSASNQYLLSGDTDAAILKYDLNRLTTSSIELMTPRDTIRTHADSIRAISAHPYQDEVFLSASEDGRIILHDSRCDSRLTRAQSTLQEATEFTGLQYHPEAPHTFVTSDSSGKVCLRDVRIAFGPLSNRTNSGIVHEFVTTVSKPTTSTLAHPTASSVVFDRTGSKIAVTALGHFPTVYSLDDKFPIAQCTGRNLPDGSPVPPGQGGYANTCTMKHGAFGGLGLADDAYYAAGSDDFRAYVWEVPDVPVLKAARECYTASEWFELNNPSKLGYTTGTMHDRIAPVDLSTPLDRLTGHKSIVNTALFHPHLPYVLTAGVERHILLHSPTANAPSAVGMSLTPKDVRKPSDIATAEERRHLITALTAGPGIQTEEGDAGTIAVFDEILRQEGDLDIFQSRQWSASDEEDDGHAPFDEGTDDDILID